MSKFGQAFKQVREDISELQATGFLVREGIKQSLREEFRAKAKDPKTNTLKKIGYKAGIALTYILQ